MFNYGQSTYSNREEKEFYKWLQGEREFSEDRSRQMVLEVARLEIIATKLKCGSGKLFSKYDREINTTCAGLLASDGFRKYLLHNKSYAIDLLDALKAYMIFIKDKAKPKNITKIRKR